MRRALVGGLTLLFSGCVCSTPPVGGDGGQEDAGTPCVLDTECAFGEACVGGFCGTPVTPDAGVTCTRNEDCPSGQLCLPSTGECFTPSGNDSGEEDGGVITGDCNPGETISCGSSKLGQCRLGTASCQVINGAYAFGPCQGNVEPVAELCNGLDEDCDGLVDDGFPDLTCGVGECARSVPGCVNGAPNTCSAGSPSTEVCDNKDNDCNGTTDDMPDIVCGTGACRRTAGACDAGVPGTCVQGGPTSEICDGIDNDCNALTDDGFLNVSCGDGVCFNSVYPCADGGVVACQQLPGSPSENCSNFLDDNCNGLVNEGCACVTGQTVQCYTGPSGTQNTPPCQYGTLYCDGGVWGPCVGQVVPQTETCNTVDDNCNGTPDDMGSTTCGQGECRVTQVNCVGGVTQTCREKDAGVEICNGKDDDCNGTPDDGIANLPCGVGACFRSFPACLADGGNNTCVPGTPTPEVCNGVDDDCKDGVDNVMPVASCSTGEPGPCAAGTTTCSGGVAGCQRTYTPIPEACNNGIDDDCNGTVDIAPACCNPTINRDSDPANECTDCNDNDGTIYPGAPERCNGKDDDCDGQLDEGYDKDNDGFSMCGTVDGGGVDPRRIDCNDDAGFVFPLKSFDCGPCATAACPFCSGTGACVAGTGNSIDDNCNGYTDETCGCNPTLDSDSDGVRDCDDCVDNDNQIYPGRPESCDGKDNDCNRLTIDNCGVSQPCGYDPPGPGGTVPFPAGTDQCRPDLVCVTNVSNGDLTCGSYCNQTIGAGLNDSCTTYQACDRNLIDSDKLNLCSAYPAWSGNAAMNATCSVDTDCQSHDCFTDGTVRYCSDHCNHRASCTGGTSCNVQSGLYDPQGPGIGLYYYALCRRDSLLPAGLPGSACTNNNQCRSNVCFNGLCREPCCAHSDCTAPGTACGLGPSQALDSTTRLKSVVPVCWNTAGTRPSGAACTTNAECKSRICDSVQGICADICCNDSSCTTPGQTCEPLPLTIPDGGIVDVVRACVFSPMPSRIQMRPVP